MKRKKITYQYCFHWSFVSCEHEQRKLSEKLCIDSLDSNIFISSEYLHRWMEKEGMLSHGLLLSSRISCFMKKKQAAEWSKFPLSCFTNREMTLQLNFFFLKKGSEFLCQSIADISRRKVHIFSVFYPAKHYWMQFRFMSLWALHMTTSQLPLAGKYLVVLTSLASGALGGVMLANIIRHCLLLAHTEIIAVFLLLQTSRYS